MAIDQARRIGGDGCRKSPDVLAGVRRRSKECAALCTSARVYRLRDNSPPLYLNAASYRATAAELGVGFTGEAQVMDPRTPRAMVVH